jgi:hypothetical protein
VPQGVIVGPSEGSVKRAGDSGGLLANFLRGWGHGKQERVRKVWMLDC